MINWLPVLAMALLLTVACDRQGASPASGHTAQPAAASPVAPGSNGYPAPGSNGHPAPESNGSPSHIATMLVSAHPSQPVLALSGRIAYAEDRYSRISSPLQGRVTEVRAKLGETVKAGTTLLVVDSPSIAEAYSDFVKEHSDLSFSTRAFELAVELHRVQAMPFKDYKQAENDLIKDQVGFRRAKERLLSLKVPASELEKPLAQQHITSRFELRSPIAGTVMERNVTPGELVGDDPSEVLFTVADLDTLQVVADVYERDIRLLKVGQVATATVEAYPGSRFPAAIAAIGDVVDPSTRTIKVRAWVNNQERKLKPEMFARLHVPVGDETPFITVPNEAVFEAEGGFYVYVQDGPEHYSQRAVKVEKLPENRMRVLEGLSPDERVVVKGAILLKAMLLRS